MKTTIRHVAEIAGVSITTVSHVLNNKEGTRVRPETRNKVMDAARKLNYHIGHGSRPLLPRNTGALGLLIPPLSELMPYEASFYAGVISNIERFVAGLRYGLLVETAAPAEGSGYELPRFARNGKVEGCIVLGVQEEGWGDLVVRIASALPTVSIDYEHSEVDSVVRDNFLGGAMAADYLVKSGCKNIVCLVPKSYGLNSGYSRNYTERADGFYIAAAKAGLGSDSYRIKEIDPGNWYAGVTETLTEQGVEGIFSVSEELAYLVNDAVSYYNSEIKLVSFQDFRRDNVEFGAIGCDGELLAQNGVKLLIDRIRGESLGKVRVVVRAELAEAAV